MEVLLELFIMLCHSLITQVLFFFVVLCTELDITENNFSLRAHVKTKML